MTEHELNQCGAEPIREDVEAEARRRGFTRAVWAEGGDYSLSLLVRPDADFDARFTAFDLDECEFIRVNGWLFTVEGES